MHTTTLRVLRAKPGSRPEGVTRMGVGEVAPPTIWEVLRIIV